MTGDIIKHEIGLVLANWVIFITFMYFRFFMRYNFFRYGGVTCCVLRRDR